MAINSPNEPTNSSKDLMLAEFDREKELFVINEQDGNTRLNIFISLTTTLIAAFGISKQFEDNANYGLYFLPVLTGLFFSGLFILRRLVQRNISADEIKIRLDQIRDYFKRYDNALAEYPLYDNHSEQNQNQISYKVVGNDDFSKKDQLKRYIGSRISDWKWYSPGTGGYVQIVALLSTVIFAFIIIVLSSYLAPNQFTLPREVTVNMNNTGYKIVLTLISDNSGLQENRNKVHGITGYHFLPAIIVSFFIYFLLRRWVINIYTQKLKKLDNKDQA